MNEGFIKIQRSILDWEHFQEASTLVVWITILLSCNWKTGWFHGKKVEPGEWITSINRLVDITGLTKNTIKKVLKCLCASGEIIKSETANYTKIRIVNYEKYNSETGSTIDPSLNPSFDPSFDPNIRKEKENKEKHLIVDDVVEQIPIAEVSNWLKYENDPLWKKEAIKALELSNESELYKHFDMFQSELIAQGKTHESANEIKSHFINLIRKKTKSKKYGERRTKPSVHHTDPRELVRIANNILETENRLFGR